MVTRIAASTAVLSIAVMAFVDVPAHAQGVASDKLIESITVTGARQRVELDVPAPTASKTAEDLRAQNLVNPEDALKYVPNLTIRKRYVGDRNALIGGRSFSTLQAPRGLVLMDGYLLSNFLGRFDAPRWNMIAPEEIERVDVLYGPFSAIYPGNSIGTTVQVRTRRPEERELSVRTTAFGENFDQYGSHDDYSGYQASAFFGDRFDNGAWLTLAANRQDSTSHPMQYFTISRVCDRAVPDGAGHRDTDTRDRRRVRHGSVRQTARSVRRQQRRDRPHSAEPVEAARRLRADRLAGSGGLLRRMAQRHAQRESHVHARLRPANRSGRGRVVADGIVFNVPATALAPSTRDERHLQWGTTLRTTRDTGWNGSAVFSEYRIREDSTLQANTPDPVAASGGPGTNSERDGTGWTTFELQGVYTPSTGDWTRRCAHPRVRLSPQRLSSSKARCTTPQTGAPAPARSSQDVRGETQLAGALRAGCLGAGRTLGPDARRALRGMGGQRWLSVRARRGTGGVSGA